VEGSLERIREALKHDDETELKSALEELRGRWNEAASKAYQAAETGAPGQPGAAGAEASGAGPAEDDVIEADYEVVDEEK
jgi:molecular chaperone DnaK